MGYHRDGHSPVVPTARGHLCDVSARLQRIKVRQELQAPQVGEMDRSVDSPLYVAPDNVVPDMVKTFVAYFYRHIREKNGTPQESTHEPPARGTMRSV